MWSVFCMHNILKCYLSKLFFFCCLTMGRKSCQSRASMARSPLTHTVNYACSEHKHRFYSKTVLYIHTQTWNTRSFSHLTALLLRWTLLYLANTSSAASLKTNMLIRRMNNIKSETLNNKKKGRFLTSGATTHSQLEQVFVFAWERQCWFQARGERKHT